MTMYQASHPEATETDTYLFSWITGGDQVDIFARSGNSATPFFQDAEISDMVRELGETPPVQPPPPDPEDDGIVHHSNLDYIIEACDNPNGVSPQIRDRVMKNAEIHRRDAALIEMFKKRRR